MFKRCPRVGAATDAAFVQANRTVQGAAQTAAHPDGSFAGIVVATIPVEYFATLLSAMDVGPYGTAVLRDANQALITRFPRVAGPSGVIGSKGFSKELADAMASGEKVVTYHAVNTSDGVGRINTYRRLSTVPFHLLAGNGAQVYLVEASDSFFAMLGYGREQGMRLHVSDWDAQHSKADLESLIPHLLQQGPTTLTSLYRRKDGTEFSVEVHVLPVEMQGSQVLFSASRGISALHPV